MQYFGVPRPVTILQVFLSSPSDLSDEREVVAEVVDELNASWRKDATFQLRLLTWEADTRPALGSDAQAVINEQIGDDYDIFVGIMGHRFGSQTARAGSGTEEEFYRAKSRFQGDPKSISVLFYFKNAPTAPSEIDLEQLKMVRTFQEQLKSVALIRIFESKDELARLMRIHLSQEVEAWKGRLARGVEPAMESTPKLEPTTFPISEQPPEITEEEGYLDLLEQGEEEMANLVNTMERIAAAMRDIGERTNKRAEEMNDLAVKSTQTGKTDLKAIKHVATQTAEDLDNFAAQLETEVPLFAQGFKSALDPYIKVVGMPDAPGNDPEQLGAAAKSVSEMMVNNQSAIEAYRKLNASLSSTPRMTTAFNRARRRALTAIDALISESETAYRLSAELAEAIQSRLTSEIPKDFVDALADFDKQRFVSMETALNETPPGA